MKKNRMYKILFIEMILEHFGVLKVMKNRYLKLVLIEDIILGHIPISLVHLIVDQLEEDLWYLLETAEIAIV